MKKSEINQIPEDHPFYRDIKKETRTIIYKLASIRKEDTPGNKRKEIIPTSENIPAIDAVVDEKGNVFNIGFVIRTDPKTGEVIPGEIVLGSSNYGRLIINPKTATPRQIAMYKYLEICNHNGSNEMRNKNSIVRIYRLKPEEMAQGKVAKKQNVIVVSSKILELNVDQLRSIARILSVADVEIAGESELKEALLNEVEKDPVKVRVILDDINSDVDSVLRKAKELEVISHDKNKGIFFHEGNEVFKYQPAVSVKPYALFAEYLNTQNNDLLLLITKQVKLKEEEPKE